jgi:molybdate transport system substrate-binding protein
MKTPLKIVGNSCAFLVFLLLVLAGCSRPNKNLVVATATSVQYVMKELVEEFQKESGIPTEMVVGASGKLTAQIREGAPFDVFVSADTRYPAEIYRNGGGEEAPKVYALGTLISWSADSTLNLTGRDFLLNPAFQKIALPNPQTAPFGEAAVAAMKGMGVYDKVKTKLVYGESIAQTSQYIAGGSAEVGFSALSVVLAKEMKGKGKWAVVDTTLYAPIEQAVLLLRHSDGSPKKKNARRFYDFLFSPKAKAIFLKYGYRQN